MAAAFRPRGRPLDQNISYDANAPTRPTHAVFSSPLHHGEPTHSMATYADARPSTMNHNGARDIEYSPKHTSPDEPVPQSSPPQQHDAIPKTTPSIQNQNPTAPPPPPPPLLPNTAPPGQFDMLPPPNSTHPSWQSLHDYAQTHAAAHGYALSINTTAKNRSRIKLACVCYGQPKNTHKLTPETRVRKNRVSYKTGCRMWVEGKRVDGEAGGATGMGVWVLRVGEASHNHAGRPSEGWAVQRKRTWGVVGGRIGVGGVTAKEEEARRVSDCKQGAEEGEAGDGDEEGVNVEGGDSQQQPRANHSLESGGIVWKIVEQEMLRKGSDVNQGRDRGVGRTVDVLQARLPGIRIFKRDVYNIRAQIKRARKAAGQQVGEGLGSDHEEGDGVVDVDEDADVGAEDDDGGAEPSSGDAGATKLANNHQQTQAQTQTQQQPLDRRWSTPTHTHTHTSNTLPPYPHPHPHAHPPTLSPPNPPPSSTPQIDPFLSTTSPRPSTSPRRSSMHTQWEQREVGRLIAENTELRRLLGERTAELKERSIELASLRSQMDYLMLTGR